MNTEDTLRSFFIVGAPRCGTTSLSRYLRRHPDICFATPKEPQYFVLLDQRKSESNEAVRSRYLRSYFPGLSPEHEYIGEGSVSYLYSEFAIRKILEVFPDARFIVSLRNPSELMVSYHARMLFVREEVETDLEKAWDLQEVRASGELVPRLCRDPRMLQYAEVGRHAHYLDQLWRIAGKERVQAVFLEDLVTEPTSVYGQVLKFLELEHDGRTYFKRKRETKRHRFNWLQSLSFGKVGVPVPLLIGLHMNHGGRVRRVIRPIKNLIRGFNTREGEAAPPVHPTMRTRLVDHFRPEVDRLEAMLGRDLSHWK